jgi:outer membrane protein, heavy metal efflux system
LPDALGRYASLSVASFCEDHVRITICRYNLSSLVTALALLCTGCVGRPPVPAPSIDEFHIVGSDAPIKLTVEGQPVDVDRPEPEQLSLVVAAQRALEVSPDIQIALSRARAAWADARQERLLPNPVLNVAVRFPEDGGDSVIEAGLSQDVLAIMTLARRASAADQRVRAATAEVLVAVLDVLAEVQDAYVSTQASDAELAVLADRKQLIDRLLQIARSRVQAGESPQLDALSVEADRVALDVEIAEKTAEGRQRRLVLARLIGQPSGAAEWTLPAWSPSAVSVGNEHELMRSAIIRRPEVQARQWELAALGDDLRLAQWSAFQTVELGVDAEREEDWAVGPAISTPLPIFDFGPARRDKASAQLVEARHVLTRTGRQVIQEVRQAHGTLRAAQASLSKAQTDLVPLQERRREQAEAAYRNGFTDITTVLLAEQQAQETRSKVIELQRKVSSARVQLDRAVGGPGAVAEAEEAATQPVNSRQNSEGVER